MMKKVFYILVESATAGMALYTRLVERGCHVRIAPAPRGETTCCGMSLRVLPDDMAAVRAALDSDASLTYDRVVELVDDVDPQRNEFC